jgi:virginiamycin B lyase
LLRGLLGLLVALAYGGPAGVVAAPARTDPRAPMASLRVQATIKIGRTADWVAISPGAVWVGSTSPDAVNRIDPTTNRLVATVALPGEPCAGLAVGFGALWVPLCGKTPRLARVDLASNAVTEIPGAGPPMGEGGITASPDSVWLVIDKAGTLARIDPASGGIRQRVSLPPGSYNPLYYRGVVWVTNVAGAAVAAVDAASGAVRATVPTGPNPRFLAAGAGAIWTLDQGDGALTEIDARTRRPIRTVALGTPGHGGDIKFSRGVVWTTMAHVPLTATDAATGEVLRQWVGKGGDSLAVGGGAIWLTDYSAGTISRIRVEDALLTR